MQTWVCGNCGGKTESVARPYWCRRCAHFGKFDVIVYSPANAPPARAPVKASELGGGEHAPSLGLKWDELLGRVGQPLKFVMSGPAGSHKTSEALDFSQAVSSAWGQVLYDAVDEGFESVSFRDKIRRLEIRDVFLINAYWAAVAREAASGRWALICLDTANAIGATPGEIDEYTRATDVSWLVLLEWTKSGWFKGTSSWSHWADVHCELTSDGEVVVVKNRYSKLKRERIHA